MQNGDAVLDEAAEQDEVEDEVEDGAGTEAEEFQETIADEASGVEAQKEPENSLFEEGQRGGLLWEADDRSVAHEASMRRSPADDGSDVQEVPDTPPMGQLGKRQELGQPARSSGRAEAAGEDCLLCRLQ